jgi:hypothetical protein
VNLGGVRAAKETRLKITTTTRCTLRVAALALTAIAVSGCCILPPHEWGRGEGRGRGEQRYEQGGRGGAGGNGGGGYGRGEQQREWDGRGR